MSLNAVYLGDITDSQVIYRLTNVVRLHLLNVKLFRSDGALKEAALPIDRATTLYSGSKKKNKKKKKTNTRERPARRPLAFGRYPKRAIKNIEHEDSTYRPVKSCIQRVLRLLKRHDQLFFLPKRPANFENSTDPSGIPPNCRKFFESFTFYCKYLSCRLKHLH